MNFSKKNILNISILICGLFFNLGCMKVMNSSSGDYALENASLSFLNAYGVMQAKCFSCHQEFNTTQDVLISKGWVVRGDALNSPMYNRLEGSDGPGVKNMPQTGSLTSSDREIIKNWINGL